MGDERDGRCDSRQLTRRAHSHCEDWLRLGLLMVADEKSKFVAVVDIRRNNAKLHDVYQDQSRTCGSRVKKYLQIDLLERICLLRTGLST